MILPYNTDANLYHPPIATVSLIVITTLFFFVYPLRTNNNLSSQQLVTLVEQMYEDEALSKEEYRSYMEDLSESEDEFDIRAMLEGNLETEVEPDTEITIPAPDPLSLQYGRGLRPWQWVTSRFLHGNILHLAGNMIWLWTFGLVVEGKVGWRYFLMIYFGILVGGCIVEQTMLLGVYPTPWACSLGMSSVVFGLMAIAMLWIPSHDIHCLVGIWPWSFPAIGVGGFFLLLNVITGILLFDYDSFTAASYPLLDAMGGLIGVGVGFAFLKYDLVETDNWDILSIWAGKHRLSYDEANQAVTASESYQAGQATQIENGLAQIREVLDEGTSPQLAYRAHLNMQRKYESWHLPDAEFLLIIKQLCGQRNFEIALQAIHEYLRTSRNKASQVRLKQASIFLDELDRPGEALSALAHLDRQSLSDRERALYRQLRSKANAQKDDDLLGILDD